MEEDRLRLGVHTACLVCPLRSNPAYRDFSPEELEFTRHFRSGELHAGAGSAIFHEGNQNAHLYTALSGWGFRYKTLSDGRRQILNYILPGDMIGLQGAIFEEMNHSVEALTEMRLCVFERKPLYSLFEKHPGLGYDLTWIAAQEESILDEHLLSVGQRTAIERAAYLLAFLHHRGRASGVLTSERTLMPLTQAHVADTLGLSIVHTNKTLRKLALSGALRWLDRGCEVLDPDALQRLAKWTPNDQRRRPFL
ncbi:Crp/Fnr family transcriptional regulator [Rhizobium paknamense]|uniref:CRP-like cAMP-binding protein n=1 Tax=Rhizobium paknamense TaxID=1206817 RepID=A0ABU0IGB5_9HYPH|nr:Crp/Fnr family transcriptional regulator [Rhizobium paknamense]MDQ0456291.1 CRP-like cAMP-binding protein [Rhizobium paknamense]